MSPSVSHAATEPPPLPEAAELPSGPARLAFAENRQRKVADDWSKIVIRGGILSLLTLTLYRFWMKTQQRQLLWRETRIDGDGFEYTGTPLELFIGSMIAIAILAVWLGIANLGLSFVQLAAWQDLESGYLLSLFLLTPLVAFATYRARRYRMLRTKWRGVRFGMDGSAIKYTGRWLLWTLLQIVTLGLATPHKQMALEGFMTRHMLYGDTRFQWRPEPGAIKRLFGNWLLPWLATALLMGAVAYNAYRMRMAGLEDDPVAQLEAIQSQMTMTFGILGIMMIAVYPLYLRYKAREIGTMLSSRQLLDARCESRLGWGVTGKPVLATIGYGLLLSIPVGMCLGFLLFLGFGLALVFDGKSLEDMAGAGLEAGLFNSLPSRIAFFGGLYLYYGGFIIFSLWLGSLIYLRRLITYICRGTVVHNIESLDTVRQRTKTDQIESEGFADALDIGGI